MVGFLFASDLIVKKAPGYLERWNTPEVQHSPLKMNGWKPSFFCWNAFCQTSGVCICIEIYTHTYIIITENYTYINMYIYFYLHKYIYESIHTCNPNDLYFWRSTTLQNNTEIPIKTRVIWVPGTYINPSFFLCEIKFSRIFLVEVHPSGRFGHASEDAELHTYQGQESLLVLWGWV